MAWYDASNAASITASSNLVSQWNDLSGHGYHLVQGNGVDKPKWGLTTLNGRNTVDYWWNGSNHFMQYNSFPSVPQPFTILSVVDITDSTQNTRIIDTGPAASRILVDLSNPNYGMYAGTGGMSGGTATNGGHQIAAVFNGASSAIYVDSALTVTGNPGSNAAGAGQWDISGDGFGNMAGKIAEFAIVPGVISARDLASWNAYVQSKWGFSWTPAYLPNLVGWYDASKTSSITAIGGAVSQWSDLSGNAHHLTQATGANQPSTGVDTLNGLNALKFDGSNDGLACGSRLTSGTTWSIALVAKSLSAGAGQSTLAIFDVVGVGGEGRIYRTASDGIGAYDGSVLSSGSTYGTASPHAVLATNDGSGNGVIYVDSTTGASGAIGSTAPGGGFSIGHIDNSASEFFNGDIAEVIVTTAVVGSTDRSSLMAYLKAKWGIWNPASPGDLKAWWKADDLASITQSSGRVSQLNDQSGGGFHMTQATSGLQPLTGSHTRNGLNALYFDETRHDSIASTGSMGMNQPYSWHWIGNSDNTDLTSGELLTGLASKGTNLAIVNSGGFKWRIFDMWNTVTAITGPAWNSSLHLHSFTVDGSGNCMYYIDGILVGTGSGVNTNTINAWQIFGDFAQGDFCEAWIGTTAHDLTTVGKARTYARAKWGTP